MAQSISHRGPDDSGTWTDPRAGIAFAFVRLSIIDVSPAGHQPMASYSGRFTIVFNGEIYNHGELRDRLPVHRWRGHSDTEILLACVEAWGVQRTLESAVGMFAFALWDGDERALYLARDRLGEKPLYYGKQDGLLLFASELKALRAHPQFRGKVDRGALALFLRRCYVPSPHSIFHGVRKVRPGTLVKLWEDGREESTVYWSLENTVITGARNPFIGSDEDAAAAVEESLSRSVSLQMVADVPLGAFLSGGVDSSTVVALMQASSQRPVKTFTVGFHDEGFNEARHAGAVARHLGTDHTELFVTADEVRAAIPRLPRLYDEPFADSSQIPTFLIAQLARTAVTVSLSGDGGDELFGGYNRYLWADRIWRKVAWLPRPLRQAVSYAIASMPAGGWDHVNASIGAFVPRRYRVTQLGDKLHKLAERMHSARDIDDLYRSLVSEWSRPSDILLDAKEPATLLEERSAWPPDLEPEHRMMYLDAMTYVPDDILTKVDRATMGVSLEARLPLLDHRVVEIAWRLPLRMKIRDGIGKWILRKVLYRHVPSHLIERPKMGFAIPLADWLRGPLRDWAESLLDERRLANEGFFRPKAVRHAWREHVSGERDWQLRLWNVLMFQSWLSEQR